MKRLARACLLMSMWSVAAARSEPRDVTVSYLRAAAGALSDGDKVTFTAMFDGSKGLREAVGPVMRNKGYSRFQVIDPQAKAVYDSVYCEQRSSVFDTLVGVSGQKLFYFWGYRTRGENREDAMVVTDVRPVVPLDLVQKATPAAGPLRLRVVLTDLATSNRTVLVNVETGKMYRVLGTGLMIEAEPPPPEGLQTFHGR